jgi:hypothetical protein
MVQVLFLAVHLIHPIVAIALASLVLLVVLGTGQVASVEDPWRCNRLLEDWFEFCQRYGNTLLLQKW